MLSFSSCVMQHTKRSTKKVPPIEITTSWPLHWHASSLTLTSGADLKYLLLQSLNPILKILEFKYRKSSIKPSGGLIFSNTFEGGEGGGDLIVGLSRLRWAPFEHFFEFGALFCILSTLKHFFSLWATFEQYFTFRPNFEQHMSSKTF